MTPKDEAINLVQHFCFKLGVKEYEKAKHCAIYLCHMLVMETLDIVRIKHWKEVVNEIEKL